MDAADWKIADNHIREIIDLELKHRDLALRNQAIEYERRLDQLNNENARILAAGARAVSVEKYEAEMQIAEQWRNQINRFVTATETRNEAIAKEQARLRTVIIAWITVATFALALVAAFVGPF